MADSMTGKPEHEHNRDLFEQVTVPTFDPVTQAGRRARWALLVTSLIVLLCLLSAIVSEHYLKSWRSYQRGFRKALATAAAAEGNKPRPVKHEIKQIASAEYGVLDRCTTCHTGYDDPKLSGANQPFRSHPQWVFDIHPPEKYGCTLCHGGQGLATTVEDAHGDVPHWEKPLVPAGYYDAGCGLCHTHIKAPPAGLANRGEHLFEQYDCLSCHHVNGRGRGAGPDLSGIGIKQARPDWHDLHLLLQDQSIDPVWLENYGPLQEDEITAINAYLDTLVRMPRLVKAKAIVYQKGCHGCHRINGTGGDEGPDLSLTGQKNPNRLDFTMVEGERNLASWHQAHLQDPPLIVAGSLMPQADLTQEEIDAVTLYLLSLRGADAPMNMWPPPRFAAERLGMREFATDGESLYKAFCTSCHGASGQGIRLGIFSQSFPGVASPEFLAVASDRFIQQNLMNGRPGRKMPPWGTKEGGLNASEIDSLLEYLRLKEPEAPSREAVSGARADIELGAMLYKNNCAVCHGAGGRGGIGPSLSNPVFLRTADASFIHHMLAEGREDTSMGSWRSFTERELASVIAYIKSWQSGGKLELPSLPPAASGVAGQRVFMDSCASCHGDRGEGKYAVNLVNAGLLEAASDGYLASAVKYGRCAPPPDSPQGLAAPQVTDQQLADAIGYIRQKASRIPMQAPGRPVSGNSENGAFLFAQACKGCHGERGRNGMAPELANPSFLASATDGFVQASIIRGRPSAGMPAFGSDNISYRRLAADEVNDITAFIRKLQTD